MSKLRTLLPVFFFAALGPLGAVNPAERLAGESVASEEPVLSGDNQYVQEDDLYAPARDGDSDLGEQVILRRQPTRAPLEGRANAFLFWSDNVSARSFDEEEGWYWGGSLSARWKPRLASNLWLDTYGYQDAYFYDREGLDFQSTEFGLGLIRNLPGLSDLTHFARYEFLYLHAENPTVDPASAFSFTDDRYHRLRLGGFKTLYQRPGHIVSLSANIAWDFDASADADRRTQYAARLAYDKRLTNRLRASTFYRLAYRDFINSSRNDWNQYAGIELAYTLSPWAQAHMSLLYGNNDSNLSLRDYDAWQAGLGVGVRGTF